MTRLKISNKENYQIFMSTARSIKYYSNFIRKPSLINLNLLLVFLLYYLYCFYRNCRNVIHLICIKSETWLSTIFCCHTVRYLRKKTVYHMNNKNNTSQTKQPFPILSSKFQIPLMIVPGIFELVQPGWYSPPFA